MKDLKEIAKLVDYLHCRPFEGSKRKLFDHWIAYVKETQETRFEFEVSSNEQWAKKLNHFLWVRSIFMAREDRLKDGTKMEELNDKIMMCDLLNTWANYVAVNKERGYGTLPMRVFIHDSYRLRSISLEHVRLDFMECWRSWCYHMLDVKYNPEYDDCVDHECKLCLV